MNTDRQGDALDFGDQDREIQLRYKERGQTQGARRQGRALRGSPAR